LKIAINRPNRGDFEDTGCKPVDFIPYGNYGGICKNDYERYGSDVTKEFCRYFQHTGQRWRIYFTLDRNHSSIKFNAKHETNFLLSDQSSFQTIEYYQPHYHRGLNLDVWLDKEKNFTTNVCLCPPSYYGDHCQYQNQRISLTLQFRVTSDSVQTPLVVIIYLIDLRQYGKIFHLIFIL
jgi:hypothetical protein